VGSLDAKLAWAKAAGAVGAFTWIHPGRSRDFTRRSGVPHHWLPFAFDPAVFARHASKAEKVPQPIDVGFTGASGLDKYPQRAAVLQTIRESARTATTHQPPHPPFSTAMHTLHTRIAHTLAAGHRAVPPHVAVRHPRHPEAAPTSAPQ
tara:strand:+ start:658 stop:1104 length:447 start_codon:yes stop_codon:yes gene_type:complete